MKTSMDSERVAKYIALQLNHFFSDEVLASNVLLEPVRAAFGHMETAIAPCKRFQKDGYPYFDHLHTDQYAMFLYILSNELGKEEDLRRLATKVYCLNKALHALDIFYEVILPPIFLFAHPVGTVLGKAQYGNYFVARQATTVGNVNGKYPVIGEGVVLFSSVSILGESRLGDGVCVGAGTLLVNTEIPSGNTVVGRPGGLRTWPSEKPMWLYYFDV